MGAIHDQMGQYSYALSYYKRGFEIFKQLLPPHHPDLAQSHNNIGTAYQNMGKYGEALLSYRKGLKIRWPSHNLITTLALH